VSGGIDEQDIVECVEDHREGTTLGGAVVDAEGGRHVVIELEVSFLVG